MRGPIPVVLALLVLGCGDDPPGPAVPPTAPAPTPETEPAVQHGPALAAPRSGVAIGTAHPVFVRAVAPDGRWVFLCEARRDTNGDGAIEAEVEPYHGEIFGDAVRPYLVLGSGEGEPIEDLVGSDETGRWVLVQRHGAIELIDTDTAERTPLGRMPLQHPTAFATHPSFAFGGARLARVHVGGAIVVRDLATGREAHIDPGPGLLTAIDLDPTGELVSALVAARDTDGDGRITAPTVRTSLPEARACHGLAAIYSVRGRSGDATEIRIAPASGGRARLVERMAGTYGTAAIVRDTDSALWFDEGGARTPLAPASCRGDVLVASAITATVLVHCRSDGRIVAWRGGMLAPLDAFVAVEGESRLWASSISSDGVVLIERPGLAIEPTSGVVTRFGDPEWPWVSRGRRVVLRSREGLVLADLGSGARTAIPSPSWPMLAQGRFVVAGELVIDVDRGSVLGRYHGQLHALADDGRVLVSDGDHDGPLTWRDPMPSDTTLDAWRAATAEPRIQPSR